MHFAIYSYILLVLTLLYVSISCTILHKERCTVTDISAVLHFQTNHDHNRGLFYIIAELVLGWTKQVADIRHEIKADLSGLCKLKCIDL